MTSLICSDGRLCRSGSPKNKKPRRKTRQGVASVNHPRETARCIQPTIRPTEYRCYIKEGIPYATAGAVTASWNIPSSSGQLPVPVALNAPSPTLFRDYYTSFGRKCKGLIYRYRRNKCFRLCRSAGFRRYYAKSILSFGNHGNPPCTAHSTILHSAFCILRFKTPRILSHISSFPQRCFPTFPMARILQ